MKGLREKWMMVWLTVLIMLMFGGVNGREVRVGGNLGWNQGINYTIWASQQNFYLGDWLSFRFDKKYFDVLEVNQTNYENCNSNNFITNITKGGRDYYQLTEARSYYFICSKGYCYGGMKLAIEVTNSSLPPAPSPQENHSPAVGPLMYAGNVNVMPVFVLAISVFMFLFG